MGEIDKIITDLAPETISEAVKIRGLTPEEQDQYQLAIQRYPSLAHISLSQLPKLLNDLTEKDNPEDSQIAINLVTIVTPIINFFNIKQNSPTNGSSF